VAEVWRVRSPQLAFIFGGNMDTPSQIINNRIAAAKNYGVNTPVYLDTFGGVVKGKVIKVNRPCNGIIHGNFDDLLVEVQETAHGYQLGEVVTRSAAYTPPRKHRKLRDGHYRIDTNYKFS
jgi:hypothetical protein